MLEGLADDEANNAAYPMLRKNSDHVITVIAQESSPRPFRADLGRRSSAVTHGCASALLSAVLLASVAAPIFLSQSIMLS